MIERLASALRFAASRVPLPDGRDLTFAAGLLLLASGFGQLSGPLAQIVPGAVLVAVALGFHLGRRKAGD